MQEIYYKTAKLTITDIEIAKSAASFLIYSLKFLGIY